MGPGLQAGVDPTGQLIAAGLQTGWHLRRATRQGVKACSRLH